MSTRVSHLCCCLLLISIQSHAQSRNRLNVTPILGFENGQPGAFPAGWTSNYSNTVFIDDKVVHGGRLSARIERTASSGGTFSSLTTGIPLDFPARTIEWRGFVRTEEVTNSVAVWMRQDGDAANLAFATTQGQGVKGTTGWTEYSVRLPLVPGAKQVEFGVLLNGSGRAWVDDLQFLADGRPVAAAPGPEPETRTGPLDQDHEFDAGSRVTLQSLTPVQVRSLATLAKVWGFLKYHHPEVTAGRRHWDYDLFRVLPAVLAAADTQAANKAISEWIVTLGAVPECTNCATLESSLIQLAPNLGWLEDEALLGPDLSALLRSIHRNRDTGSGSFYVSLRPTSLSPAFPNELRYAPLKLPDSGYQLLALLRYWNIVEYFNPNRDTMADDPAEAGAYWDRVLVESISPVATASDSTAFQLEMMRFIVRANDANASLWSAASLRPPTGPCSFALDFRILEGSPIIARYNTTTGFPGFNLRLGQVVRRLDGVDFDDLLKQWRPMHAASNEAGRLRDISANMGRGECGNTLVGLPSGDRIERRFPAQGALDLSATVTHDRPGKAFQMLTSEVGYLRLSLAETGSIAGVIQSAASTRGLILDLRSSPPESLVLELAAHLISGPVEFAFPTTPDPANPGAFRWGQPYTLMPQQPRYTGRVVILVDEMTQGSAELAALALRAAPGATVIGSTTAGAAAAASIVPLPAGLFASISGHGVFRYDSSPTQRVGIIPDVEVRPTLDMFSRAREEVLEASMRHLTGGPWPVVPTGPLVADLGGGVDLTFVPVQPGDFMMGCSPGDNACQGNEKPAHPVRITKSFQLGKFEVTESQWAAVAGGHSPWASAPAGLPVLTTYAGLLPFLQLLNSRGDGFRYRLPTEAEWEFSARAGTTGPTYGPLSDIAWYVPTTFPPRPDPVGQKLPNAWGLYDMLGNVCEWTEDWYRTTYDGYSLSTATVDPVGTAGDWPFGAAKVCRGGQKIVNQPPRASMRSPSNPSLYNNLSGFRVLRERLDGGAVPHLSNFQLSHTAAVSDGVVTGKVTLTSWALAGGTVVSLRTDNASLAGIPVNVTVPAGMQTATFTFPVRSVTANRDVSITATMGNESKSAALTVLPALQSSVGPLNMQFVTIPPGEFVIGCSLEDISCGGARRLVRLTKGFEIARHEVTQSQWQALMGNNPSAFTGPDLPVEQVSWNDAQQFVARLNNGNDGFRYRLPTDAEWEYAARAGTTDRYTGREFDEVAWYVDNSGASTKPVGQKKPNDWGLFDTLGNVSEWVQDRFDGIEYSTAPLVDPTGPATGTSRTLRGSNWDMIPVGVSMRYPRTPAEGSNGVGFRVVRERQTP